MVPFTYWLAVRLMISTTIGLLILMLGWGVISWQNIRLQHNEAKERLNLAVRQIDTMLDNAGRVIRNLQPYLDEACDEGVIVAMRKQVSTMPNVRTAAFARDNTIYCTAIYGSEKGLVDEESYVEGTLSFMKNNIVTPQYPLITLRKNFVDRSITVGIDGNYVHTVLKLLGNSDIILIKIGDQWMGRDGRIYPVHALSHALLVTRTSGNYPYQVLTDIPGAVNWHLVPASAPGYFIVFSLLGLFLGVLSFIALGKIGTPLAELKSSIEKQEFLPYFQPVVDGNRYCLTGCEVLMRWKHPQRGLMYPGQFIPLAEETGLIVPMTRQIMRQTSALFSPMVHCLPEGFHFAFNVCADHFHDMSLVEDCKTFLYSFGHYPVTLVLELTERELIRPNKLTDEIFKELRQIGVKFALDDFGTGHSSLAYLQRFHVDIIKIDQSFIRKIGTDSLSEHIIDNVIDLAKKLQKVVVAEGVENEEQLQYLASYQLNYLQGYLFGKPMAAEDFFLQYESLFKQRHSQTGPVV